jgi:hypothetical protein
VKTKILVTGSRHYKKFTLVRKLLKEFGAEIVVHGRAPGADECAHFAAEELGIPVRPYPADWVKHGTAAGPIRNEFMVCEEHFHKSEPITLCLAFPKAESVGTWDCITKCLLYGVDVELGDTSDPKVVERFAALVAAKRKSKRQRR